MTTKEQAQVALDEMPREDLISGYDVKGWLEDNYRTVHDALESMAGDKCDAITAKDDLFELGISFEKIDSKGYKTRIEPADVWIDDMPKEIWAASIIGRDYGFYFTSEPEYYAGKYIRADGVDGLMQTIESQKQTHDALIKKLERARDGLRYYTKGWESTGYEDENGNPVKQLWGIDGGNVARAILHEIGKE